MNKKVAGLWLRLETGYRLWYLLRFKFFESNDHQDSLRHILPSYFRPQKSILSSLT